MNSNDKLKVRAAYEYEFRLGTTVSDTARNINAVFGKGTTTKTTVSNWFRRFSCGNFDITNEPRGRPETKVNNEKLTAIVNDDPSKTTRELAAIFKVSVPTILAHLAQIGKVNRMAKKTKLK